MQPNPTPQEAEREPAVMRIQVAAAYIPRELLNEQQAQTNHSQTLATLHDRGGLDIGEAASIVLGEGWTKVCSRSVEDAWRVIFAAARAAGRAEAAAKAEAVEPLLEALTAVVMAEPTVGSFQMIQHIATDAIAEARHALSISTEEGENGG